MPSSPRNSSSTCACRRDNLLGELNDGWKVANKLLGSERFTTGHPRNAAVLLNKARQVAEFSGALARAGVPATGSRRSRSICWRSRPTTATPPRCTAHGEAPLSMAPVIKIVGGELGQRASELLVDAAGPLGRAGRRHDDRQSRRSIRPPTCSRCAASRSAAARSRSSATSSPSACSACRADAVSKARGTRIGLLLTEQQTLVRRDRRPAVRSITAGRSACATLRAAGARWTGGVARGDRGGLARDWWRSVTAGRGSAPSISRWRSNRPAGSCCMVPLVEAAAAALTLSRATDGASRGDGARRSAARVAR